MQLFEHLLRQTQAAMTVAKTMGYQPSNDETPLEIIHHAIDGKELTAEQREILDSIKSLMESIETDDVSDSELEDLVNSITDEDILAEYDEDELHIVSESGELIDTSEVDVLSEGLSRVERIRARNRFLRTKVKREMKAKIALKKHSTRDVLVRRAKRLAIKALKIKFSKKKNLADMTVADKERVEKLLASRKSLVNRLAMKLVPKVKKLEKERLA